jgi:hypothetical protein
MVVEEDVEKVIEILKDVKLRYYRMIFAKDEESES